MTTQNERIKELEAKLLSRDPMTYRALVGPAHPRTAKEPKPRDPQARYDGVLGTIKVPERRVQA